MLSERILPALQIESFVNGVLTIRGDNSSVDNATFRVFSDSIQVDFGSGFKATGAETTTTSGKLLSRLVIAGSSGEYTSYHTFDLGLLIGNDANFMSGGSRILTSYASIIGSQYHDDISAETNLNTPRFATISGGAGDDTIRGGGMIDGGDGRDLIRPSTDFIYELGLNRELKGATVNGGAGDDTIQGGTVIFGGDGNDSIESGDLHRLDHFDKISGSFSISSFGATIEGGTGNDTILGGSSINGGAGNDVIKSAIEASISSQPGQITYFGVTVLGDAGDDTITGSWQKDSLNGGVGFDLLDGRGGADLIDGWIDTDTIFGGDGDDTLLGSESTYGGLGVDQFMAPNQAQVIKVTGLNHGSFVGNLDSGSFWECEHLIGGNLADTIIFSAGGRLDRGAEGRDGDDTLIGHELDDRFFGGSGNDLLIGQGAVDYLDGNDGNDTIISGIGNDIVRGALGIDVCMELFDANYVVTPDRIFAIGMISIDSISEVEVIAISTGASDNRIIIDHFVGETIINSGSGNDLVIGGSFRDYIFTQSGTDNILGREGNDFIEAGQDKDFVDAGHGNDSVFAGDGDDRVAGGFGNDLIDLGDGNDGCDGGDGADQINGNAGNDSIVGSFGEDTVVGGEGNDVLQGDHGNDQLLGGNNDDFIIGGLGDDTLGGGSGFDAGLDPLGTNQFLEIERVV